MNFPSLCSIQDNHFALFNFWDNSWRRAPATSLHRDLHKEQQGKLKELSLALWQTKAASNEWHRDARLEDMAFCALSGKREHSPWCERMEYCAGAFSQHSCTSKIILLQLITLCPSPFLCPHPLLLCQSKENPWKTMVLFLVVFLWKCTDLFTFCLRIFSPDDSSSFPFIFILSLMLGKSVPLW